MGQKVHPVGFRLGYTKTWESRWFSGKDYVQLLHEDLRIRRYLEDKLSHAGISKVDIERVAKQLTVNIYTARPGIIIGKKGAEVERLKRELEAMTDSSIYINIREIRRPEIDASLVAENVALQLEKRVSFRRAMKRAVSTAMRFGAKGVKVSCAGRLAGAEIARTQWYREGQVPLQTLRADIDYGFAEARTTYGIIGVKVWVYKGEVLPGSVKAEEQE